LIKAQQQVLKRTGKGSADVNCRKDGKYGKKEHANHEYQVPPELDPLKM
jgi:hypothetical protein